MPMNIMFFWYRSFASSSQSVDFVSSLIDATLTISVRVSGKLFILRMFSANGSIEPYMSS